MDTNPRNARKSRAFSRFLTATLATLVVAILPATAHAQTQAPITEPDTPITITRRDPVWNGAAIGLGVGAVLGLTETLKADEKMRCSPQPRCTLGLMFGNAVSGALVGTFVDRVIPRHIDVHDEDWGDDPRSNGAAIGAGVGFGIGLYVERKGKWCGTQSVDITFCRFIIAGVGGLGGALTGFAIDSAIPTRTKIGSTPQARGRNFKIGFAFAY